MTWFHGKIVSINLANATSIVWNEKHPNGKVYRTRVNLSAGMAAMPSGDLFESYEIINGLEDRKLLASFVGYLLPLLGEIPKLEQEKRKFMTENIVEKNSVSKTYLDKYNCVRAFGDGKTKPARLPHKPILREELFIPSGYEDSENRPQYRIVTIDEKTATPYLVLIETHICEYVGYFESIKSAHMFGESRSIERLEESC